MIDQLSPDRMEALAASIVTAFASRNAIAEDETPALLARVRSTLEALVGDTDVERPLPRRTPSGFAPPRRRADLSRASWRSGIGGVRDGTG